MYNHCGKFADRSMKDKPVSQIVTPKKPRIGRQNLISTRHHTAPA